MFKKKNIDQCLCSNQPKNTGPLVIAIRDLGKHGGKSASSEIKKGFVVMRSGD